MNNPNDFFFTNSEQTNAYSACRLPPCELRSRQVTYLNLGARHTVASAVSPVEEVRDENLRLVKVDSWRRDFCHMLSLGTVSNELIKARGLYSARPPLSGTPTTISLNPISLANRTKNTRLQALKFDFRASEQCC